MEILYLFITSSDMSINSSSGELTFENASDYETQSSYTAQIFVTDGTNTTFKI